MWWSEGRCGAWWRGEVWGVVEGGGVGCGGGRRGVVEGGEVWGVVEGGEVWGVVEGGRCGVLQLMYYPLLISELSYNIALCHYKLKRYAPALKHIADVVERGIRDHPGTALHTLVVSHTSFRRGQWQRE